MIIHIIDPMLRLSTSAAGIEFRIFCIGVKMSSVSSQSLDLPLHHDLYPAIDPAGVLAGSADGKVAFISGGSSGIGRATAVALARAGARAIFLTARSEGKLEETQAVISRVSPATRCAHMLCDVKDKDQVKAAIDECVTRFDGIDIAHANAGYLDKWSKIGDSDPESWWHCFEVNVQGTYHVARYAIPHLVASAQRHRHSAISGGHLILMSSVGAQLLTPGASDYQTTKHALNRLCEFIQVDHGSDGMKCFAIHPGGVPTDLALNMPREIHSVLVDKPELAAGFITWLCSGRADWASGRYLSAQWDVDKLLSTKDDILQNDLLVNRLRTAGGLSSVLPSLYG